MAKDTVVLSISFPYHYHADHEPSVSLVKNGKILAAVEEDRITRIKHDGHCPPTNSIMDVFKIAKISPSEVTAVAIPWSSPSWQYRGYIKRSDNPLQFIRRILAYPIYKKVVLDTKRLLTRFDIDCPVYWIDHHLSHAASSYFTSGFDKSTVITFDGSGDFKSSSVYKVDGGNFKLIGYSPEEHSLGVFFEGITHACGFKPLNGEGKTMGIASYGDPRKVSHLLKKYIWSEGINIKQKQPVFEFKHKIDTNDENLFASYRHICAINSPFEDLKKSFKKEDIAAGGQNLLEEVAINVTKSALNQTKYKKLCLAGGVALNMKMNQRIREECDLEEICICPNPGDPGATLGAALYVCNNLMKKKGKKMHNKKILNSYFGREYSDSEIKKAIDEFRLSCKKIKDPAKKAAELISKGKVVAWFQGQCEFGPRALGNRSVLADPRKKGIKEKINKYLKKRDWFMPFAPSILLEDSHKYIENSCEAPFMILGFDAKKEKIEEIPAAVHVDGTLRPQTVSKKSNPLYYKLIKHFKEITGTSLILNTSFNKHGVPLVRSPKDALEHVVRGDVEYLIIGNYLIDANVNLENAKASKEFTI